MHPARIHFKSHPTMTNKRRKKNKLKSTGNKFSPVVTRGREKAKNL
jgi:hypothetical protein